MSKDLKEYNRQYYLNNLDKRKKRLIKRAEEIKTYNNEYRKEHRLELNKKNRETNAIKYKLELTNRKNDLYQKYDLSTLTQHPTIDNLSITKDGLVINNVRWVIIKSYPHPIGYIMCYKTYLHRLIAQTFIPNPENKLEVNHLNGIKGDNRIINLEWCTRAENIQHSFDVLGKKSNFIKKDKE